MTTYTAITNAEIQPGAPVASSWTTKLRDNPIAISEGAAGAPRVVVPTALSTAEMDATKVLKPNGSGGVAWSVPLVPGGQSSGSSSATPVVWLELGPEGGTYLFQGQAYSTSGATKSGSGHCTGKVVSAVGSITSFKALGGVTISFSPTTFSSTIDDTSTSTYVRITAGVVEVNIGSLCRSGAFDTGAVVNWIRI